MIFPFLVTCLDRYILIFRGVSRAQKEHSVVGLLINRKFKQPIEKNVGIGNELLFGVMQRCNGDTMKELRGLLKIFCAKNQMRINTFFSKLTRSRNTHGRIQESVLDYIINRKFPLKQDTQYLYVFNRLCLKDFLDITRITDLNDALIHLIYINSQIK